jgi:UDP-glucose 4-epimerase
MYCFSFVCSDYDTPDGTGVRDYIHVQDLASGHVAALVHGIYGTMQTNCESYNLGSGVGVSVLDMIHATEKACGHTIAYKIVPRRPGDVATCFSDPTKANKELHWRTQLSLQDAVNDSWNWQKLHPDGFNTKE